MDGLVAHTFYRNCLLACIIFFVASFTQPCLTSGIMHLRDVNIFCTTDCQDVRMHPVKNMDDTRFLECYGCNGTTTISCQMNVSVSHHPFSLQLVSQASEVSNEITSQNFSCSGETHGNYSHTPHFINCNATFSREDIANFVPYSTSQVFADLIYVSIKFATEQTTQVLLIGTLSYEHENPVFDFFMNATDLQESFAGYQDGHVLRNFPNRKDLFLLVERNLSSLCSAKKIQYQVAYGSRKLRISNWKVMEIQNATGLCSQKGVVKLFIGKERVLLLVEDEVHSASLVQMEKQEVALHIVYTYTLPPNSKVRSIYTVSRWENPRQIWQGSWSFYSILLFESGSETKIALLDKYFEVSKICSIPKWVQSAEVLDVLIIPSPAILVFLLSWNYSNECYQSILTVDASNMQLLAPPFYFPSTVNAKKLHITENEEDVVITGNEVWVSQDHGRTFARVDNSYCHSFSDVLSSSWPTDILYWMSSDSVFIFYVAGNCLARYTAENNTFGDCINPVIRTDAFGLPVYFCFNSITSSTMLVGKALNRSTPMVYPPYKLVYVYNEQGMMELPFVYSKNEQLRNAFLQYCKNVQGDMVSNDHSTTCWFHMSRGIKYSSLLTDLNITSTLLKHLTSNSSYVYQAEFFTEDNLHTALSPQLIGQTISFASLSKACWISWILNNTFAELYCSDYVMPLEAKEMLISHLLIYDTRNAERCYSVENSLTIFNDFTLGLNLNHLSTVIKKGTPVRLDKILGFVSDKNLSHAILSMTSNVNNSSLNTMCLMMENRDSLIESYDSVLCPITVTITEPKTKIIFLDIFETTRIIAHVNYSNELHDQSPRPPFTLTISGKHLVMSNVRYRRTESGVTATVYFQKEAVSEGLTTLTFHINRSPSICPIQKLHFHVFGQCPITKFLRFRYPIQFSTETWMYGSPVDSKDIQRIKDLPVNYQPPSKRGKAIPMTPNIYNVDPSQGFFRGRYKITREMIRLKQCNGKTSRNDCGCTQQMRISSKVEHSDCINRVYFLRFREFLKPNLYIVRDSNETVLQFPYQLTELNNRADFVILSQSSTPASASSPYLSFAAKSKLEFKGSGLYHFRVDVVKEKYTFCNLFTEFVIFVDGTPLPISFESLVRAATAFLFGLVLLAVFFINVNMK